MKESKSEIIQELRAAAKRNNVDFDTLYSIAKIESNLGESTTSHTGVRGLMQITKATYKSVMGGKYSESAKDQAEAGARYIRILKNQFKEEWLFVLAYNAGPGTASLAQKLYKKGLSKKEAARQAALQIFKTESKADESSNYYSRFLSAANKTDSTYNNKSIFKEKRPLLRTASGNFLCNMGPANNDITMLKDIVTKIPQAELTKRLEKIGIKRK